MTVLWRALLVSAGVAAAVALAYTLLSLQYRWGTLAQPGSGFFPFWVGVLFIVAAAGVAWEALSERPAETIEWPRGVELARVVAIAAIAIGYAVLLVLVGHAIAGASAAFAVMMVMGIRRWWLAAALAVAVGVGSAYLFTDLLGVPLPAGVVFE